VRRNNINTTGKTATPELGVQFHNRLSSVDTPPNMNQSNNCRDAKQTDSRGHRLSDRVSRQVRSP
jgi:hypothetical protein